MITRIGNHGVLHQIVEHNGILHVGGIVADDPALDMAGQTTQALHKLARLLEANGSGDRPHSADFPDVGRRLVSDVDVGALGLTPIHGLSRPRLVRTPRSACSMWPRGSSTC